MEKRNIENYAHTNGKEPTKYGDFSCKQFGQFLIKKGHI
jgi:hypothetical protein